MGKLPPMINRILIAFVYRFIWHDGSQFVYVIPHKWWSLLAWRKSRNVTRFDNYLIMSFIANEGEKLRGLDK